MPTPLHQGVAISMVFRRILLLIGLFPFGSCLLFPTALWLTGFLLRWFTDYSLLVVLGTVAFTVLAHHTIYQYATSKVALQVSLEKTRVKVPVAAFVLSCFLAKYIIGPLEPFLPTKLMDCTKSIPLIAPLFAIRVAGTMVVAGIFVACRFVGPMSISKYIII